MMESQLDGRKIQAYLDGELDVSATLEFEREINSDPELRKYVEIEKASMLSLRRKLNRAEAPAWLTQKVEDGIRELSEKEKKSARKNLGFFAGFNWRPALAIAVLCILVVMASIPLINASGISAGPGGIALTGSPGSEILKTSYSNKGDIQVLKGEMVCLDKELHRVCPEAGKIAKQLAFKTEDGLIFRIDPIDGNPSILGYLVNYENLHRKVEVTGRVFSSFRTIQTESIQNI